MTCVKIRRAERTDIRFLAWAILVASRGHLSRGWFDISLGKPEAECLEFLRRLTITTTQSRWHYSRFLVVEDGLSPVATLSAFRAADAYLLSPPAIAEVASDLGFSQTEQALIWRRGAPLFRCTISPADDSLIIDSVGTLPGYRRRGYINTLLERAMADGHARGLTEAEISVFVGNELAERAYSKAGFHAISDHRNSDFEAAFGSAGIRRLVRAIGS